MVRWGTELEVKSAALRDLRSLIKLPDAPGIA